MKLVVDLLGSDIRTQLVSGFAEFNRTSCFGSVGIHRRCGLVGPYRADRRFSDKFAAMVQGFKSGRARSSAA